MGAARKAQVTTLLREGVLVFRRMTAVEEPGPLFAFELEPLSRDPQIPFEAVLGQPLTVAPELQDGSRRCFNGFVIRFSQAGTVGHFARHPGSPQSLSAAIGCIFWSDRVRPVPRWKLPLIAT